MNQVPEGEAILERSLGHLERLVREYPGVAEYRSEQALALGYLGYSRSLRDFEAAREPLERALALREELARQAPDSLEFQSELVETCLRTATAYSNARQPLRVGALLDHVRLVSERLTREHPDIPMFALYHGWIKLNDATNTALSGDHVAATAAAERALAEIPTSEVAMIYAACCHAAASGVAARDPALPEVQRAARAKAYGDRAMELLRKVRSGGFLDRPFFAQRVANDPDLAALRGRADFEEFLRGLNAAPR